MEKFAQIHCHSCFSVYDAMNTPEELVAKAVEKGHSAIALTDHGAMGGLYRLQKAALKNDIKPILGMESYVVENLVDMSADGKKRLRRQNNHLITIAKNEQGWKSLLRLNYLSNSNEEHFYYKPRFTFDELWANHEGLIVSSACLASIIARKLLAGDDEAAEKYFDKFLEVFGDDFFAEVQLNEVEGQKEYNDFLIYQANKKGVPIIIGGDVHYTEPEGFLTQKLAFAIRGDENEVGQEFAAKKLFYHGIDDYKNFNKEFGFGYSESQIDEWCRNTTVLADKVDFLIPERTKMMLPRQAFDEFGDLKEKAKKGLADHFGTSYENCPNEYKERLEKELYLMWKKGISRYILCLSDVIRWCDENKVSHGLGRGSAAGSLVLTCLGITGWAIDPIKNGLLFERFVSEQRLPDVMIDYSKKENKGK